ncbi:MULTISPECIES: hypothetical protein [Polaromonas]|uniref:Uncharacterized protein n=1 Tax=Polaromonas aquatica TaxID=332657 RepID=A0ABW1TVZ1_9BURK
MHRPDYLALDEQGREYRRKAKLIGELPVGARAFALIEATAVIATKTGLNPVKQIPFGSPVFTAFDGMNRPKAKHHAESKLLLTHGDDVSLDYCPCYN